MEATLDEDKLNEKVKIDSIVNRLSLSQRLVSSYLIPGLIHRRI